MVKWKIFSHVVKDDGCKMADRILPKASIVEIAVKGGYINPVSLKRSNVFLVRKRKVPIKENPRDTKIALTSAQEHARKCRK